MNILIKSAKIIDPKSEFHNTTQDLLIEKGMISQIGNLAGLTAAYVLGNLVLKNGKLLKTD